MKKITLNNLNDVFSSKFESQETAELKGFELQEEFFVDFSGFGSSDEPALTKEQFLTELELFLKERSKEAFYACLTNVGQFQVYVGIFTKTGKKQCKKVDNNTLEIIKDDRTRLIRLHETDILEFSADGKKVTLDSGGWQTNVTKDRMNKFLPDWISISQKKGEWHVTEAGEIKQYFDGMTLNI